MSRSPPPSREAPSREALEQYAARCNANPSLRGLGAQVEFPDAQRVRIRLEAISPLMRGGMGDEAVVNGAVLAALCDVLIGCTCGLVDPETRSATVQLGIRFERPL